jgi:hypothetical protein
MTPLKGKNMENENKRLYFFIRMSTNVLLISVYNLSLFVIYKTILTLA